MVRVLTIVDKVFSSWGKMPVTDENGQLVYEARAEPSLWNSIWNLHTPHREFASIRSKFLSWNPTWHIDGEFGAFKVRRKRWSLTRGYRAVGGPFDNAELKGDFWNFAYRIHYQGKEIARAKGKSLSLDDRHDIEVLDNDSRTELFIVIFITVLQIDRLESRSNS